MRDTTAALRRRADRDSYRFVSLALALCLSYLCVAVSLPVISIFVTRKLQFENAAAGLAVGIAFAKAARLSL